MQKGKAIPAPAIRKPCLERWDNMRGDNRTRLCEHCQLNVRNLSAMSRRDVARVLSANPSERVCITYLRDPDGSVVTRTTLLRERLFAPVKRSLSHLLRPLVPLALALCKTPQKNILIGTWSIVDRRRGDDASAITFNEDHSFVSLTRNRVGHEKIDERGSWYADEKHVHIWRDRKKYVWDIIALSRDELRMKSTDQVIVYMRVSNASSLTANHRCSP